MAMKSRVFLLLILTAASLSVSLNSCKKENTAKSNVSIVGKWNVLRETFTVLDSTGFIINDDTSTYYSGTFTLDFRESGLLINTEIDGSTTYSDSSYYSLTGMTLKISDNPDMSSPNSFIVQNLTSSDLNLAFDMAMGDGYISKNTISAKR
jgi:hypothetical protein